MLLFLQCAVKAMSYADRIQSSRIKPLVPILRQQVEQVDLLRQWATSNSPSMLSHLWYAFSSGVIENISSISCRLRSVTANDLGFGFFLPLSSAEITFIRSTMPWSSV